MPFWLLKTEPSDYGFADLQREGRTVWSGVSNPAALKHLRQMRAGDLAMIYHTGDEKRIVGIAQIASDPYADPKAGAANRVVADLKPRRALKKPVTLASLKSDRRFKDFALVRISRLSVMPVPDDLWTAILQMAGE